MSFLSKLFGGGGSEPKEPEPIIYKDCRIFPEPMKDGGKFRMAARIEKDFGEETKVHQLIRADTFEQADTAVEAAIVKAKQVIDQQGDTIF